MAAIAKNTVFWNRTSCSSVERHGFSEKRTDVIFRASKQPKKTQGASYLADHRGLRHKMTSFARSLESSVRIPLKTWKSVRLFCVFLVLYVGSCLATGRSPVQGVLPTVYGNNKVKKRPKSNRRTAELYIDR
jgi:hypothetical protein